MKPYGLRVIEFPDVGDIKEMGAKSSCGRFRKKGGDYNGYASGTVKDRTRRRWKRKARRQGLNDICAQGSECD